MPHQGLLLRPLAPILLALALIGPLPAAVAAGPPASAARLFDIPAQPLARALQIFAQQADLEILFIADSVGERRSRDLSGRMTPQQALDALLDGTGLEHLLNGEIVVVRAPAKPPAETPATFLGDALVTGTLIRGGRSASPLILLDRAYIQRSGTTTTRQLMESLPQNFGGGDNEGTMASPGGSPLNVAMGSSINLRGLGSDATLVLIDGHRIAPAAFGQFVDISMIPLSAVERIEILADGASATYGSDAVGGVVNFILREDIERAETHLQGGVVTEGSLDEFQFNQTAGTHWPAGHALLVYDYAQRSNLAAADRDYADVGDPFDLLPAHETHSLLVAATTAFSERATLRGTTLYSRREAEWQLFDSLTGVPLSTPAVTHQWSAALGADFTLSERWQARFDGHHSRNNTDRDVITPEDHQPAERNQLTITSADATLDGGLFRAPGGEIKLALGVHARRERYVQRGRGDFESDRDVAAVFGELSLPVVDSLALSLAGRYEHSSDYGSTTTPKVGLLWSPVNRLTLRSTYGRSFRAPALSEFDASNASSLLFDFPDPAAADGTTLALLLSGNNAALDPETATTWTAGIDVQPAVTGDLQIGVTYFSTDFGDRIVEPLPGVEALSVFNHAPLYSSLIDRHPDPVVVSQLTALPSFSNLYGPYTAEGVEAVIDRRLQNISVTRVSGLDFLASWLKPTALGEWTVQLNVSYLLTFDDALTPEAPAHDVLDTAYHPIDLSARAGFSWQRGAWTTSAFLNYLDDSTNETTTPAAPVGSWTTLDLQLSAVFDHTRLALSVTNALDAKPPSLSSPAAQFQLGYDPTNASALGRFISLALTQSW